MDFITTYLIFYFSNSSLEIFKFQILGAEFKFLTSSTLTLLNHYIFIWISLAN